MYVERKLCKLHPIYLLETTNNCEICTIPYFNER